MPTITQFFYLEMSTSERSIYTHVCIFAYIYMHLHAYKNMVVFARILVCFDIYINLRVSSISHLKTIMNLTCTVTDNRTLSDRKCWIRCTDKPSTQQYLRSHEIWFWTGSRMKLLQGNFGRPVSKRAKLYVCRIHAIHVLNLRSILKATDW